jgi:hypothetical protein
LHLPPPPKETSPLLHRFQDVSPPIFFQDPEGQNLGIQVDRDEDDDHITIRIVKNPPDPSIQEKRQANAST